MWLKFIIKKKKRERKKGRKNIIFEKYNTAFILCTFSSEISLEVNIYPSFQRDIFFKTLPSF